MSKTTLIIDGYGFIFRAFHSLPPLTDLHGSPVGAVYGFTSMLLKVVAEFAPNNAVVVFDSGKENFRHKLYPAYKANRPEAPEDLKPQFSLCREAALALNFKIIEKEGFEADDIIATIVREAIANKEKAIIISSDKDLMQLINHDIIMYDGVKGKFIREAEVIEKFGVEPNKVVDILSIIGDASDNIPGIKGIGPKGALDLLLQFGTLENLLNNIDKLPEGKKKQYIENAKENAILSKKLILLDDRVPLGELFNQMKFEQPSSESLLSFLNKFNFKSLIAKAEKIFNLTLAPDAPSLRTEVKTHNISDLITLKNILEKAKTNGKIALEFLKDKNNITIGLSLDPHEAFFMVFGNIDSNNLFNQEERAFLNAAIIEIKNILEDLSILKITYDVKNIYSIYRSLKEEIYLEAVEDIKIMHYAFNMGRSSHELNDIIKEYLPSIESLDKFSSPALIFLLYTDLKHGLKASKSLAIYSNIDRPLARILYELEKTGIKINPQILRELSKEFAEDITTYEEKIYQLSGIKFNVASSKQLGDVLFNSMGLPNVKKTKTGTYSTDASILTELSEAGYEIADIILKWRRISKLKNTYTDVLPLLADPKTHRIHTTFLQTSTNTARFSSQDPNLQNIPVRNEYGGKIRAAFIAEGGYKLISADYSQIELRLLSDMGNVEVLIDAFKHGKDIHDATAAKMFKVSIEEITPELRRRAKAVNYGIIYGISSFGLAKQLGVSNQEAASYIKKYFEEYEGIKNYMEEAKDFAHKHGYVKSIFGRKCYIKDINSSNRQLKAFSERAAINAPLQASTSDIARLAMINTRDYLKKEGFKTRLILQIHDELLFESPEVEVERAKKAIKTIMQNIVKLKVPLTVGVHAGNNWEEIH